MKLFIMGICGFVGSTVACALQDVRGAGETLEVFSDHKVDADKTARPFDIPWMAVDSSRAKSFWKWQPQSGFKEIFDEIAKHGQQHENWLELSADF